MMKGKTSVGEQTPIGVFAKRRNHGVARGKFCQGKDFGSRLKGFRV